MEILERDFRKQVMALITGLGGHVTNHEDSWQPGIADLSFALGGVDCWIELKAAAPIGALNDRIKCGFTHEQAKWLKDRYKVGNGRVYGLVRVWLPVTSTVEFWLVPAILVKDLTDTVTMDFAASRVSKFQFLHEALNEVLK